MAKAQPDERGHWGRYGGRYVPETLMVALNELTTAFTAAQEDETFRVELAPGAASRVDLELGVGLPADGSLDDAR